MAEREGAYRPTIKVQSTSREVEIQEALTAALHDCPIPVSEQKWNLPLFMNRQALSKLLGMYHLYERFLPVTGCILEFGVRWGHNMALLVNLRAILEPYNHSRKIIGFDTFAGFPSVHAKDGRDADVIRKGAMGVTTGYEAFLEGILSLHEENAPISHLKKFELVKGDATQTLPRYLEENPHTIVAFAYFDFDIYEPTVEALRRILPRCTKGTVIGFDEINHPVYPGETTAVLETLGLDRYALKRNPYYVTSNYLVIE